MGDRRCCCACWLSSDDFNRANNTDLGDDWAEDAIGNWEILSNQLYEEGNTGTNVIYQPNHGKARMVVSVELIDEVANNVYRVIVNYKDDDNYMYAQLEVNSGAAGASVISLYKVEGGVHTGLESQNITLLNFPVGSRAFTVCLGENAFAVTLSAVSADFCVWVAGGPVHVDGYKSGLGNNNIQAIYYDNFSMAEHWDDNPRCSPCCPCRCGDRPVAPTLTATYAGVGQCDTPLTGLSATLVANASRLYWDGQVSGGCLDKLKIRLTCAEDKDDPTTWKIAFDPSEMDDPSKRFCWYTANIYADESSSCEPLSLVFKFGPRENGSPAICPPDCWPCGSTGPAMPPPYIYTEYVIYITE